MRAKAVLISLHAIIGMVTNAQRPTMVLTFTADNNGTYVQLDSIKVMNRPQGGDTVLYYPDTMLVLNYQLGIPEINNETGYLQVFQNYPNPAADQTTISLFVPEKDKVNMRATDMLGRLILNTDRVLDKGIHSFRFTPGGGNLNFFTAQWRGKSGSIKILQTSSNSNRACSLEYLGNDASSPQLKAIEEIRGFSLSIGDTLLYIGYAYTIESGMLDAPEESQSYTFQFATNIPCPATPIVEYEGQVYNTIQIFSQCWLKENLNVGTMIQGVDSADDNSIIEKYCYNNEPDSCTKYGGLYQWDEMMQYTTQQGVQGICPPGWHLPADEEWKVLEGAMDSQYGIGDPEWDRGGFRGYDVGTSIKTKSGWYDGKNGTDLFGFSGMPAGFRHIYGDTWGISEGGSWWSTLKYEGYDACSRGLHFSVMWGICRGEDEKRLGFSVRCLKD